MANIVITCRRPGHGWDIITIPLQEWRLYRRSARSVLNYKNGGRESVYHGFTYYLELRWQYLSQEDHELLMHIITCIRLGGEAKWTNITDFTYLNFSPVNKPDMHLDVEQDEIVEAQGEWVEKMPFEITFIVTRAVTGAYDNA